MEPWLTLLTGVVLALATAFFTSRFYVHQAKADLQKDLERRFNERRWEIYTAFSGILIDMIQASTDNRLNKDLPRLIRELQAFIGRLWLVGSDDVVEAVLDWRRSTADAASDTPMGSTRSMMKLLKILVAMRRDLGDARTQLTARDILSWEVVP
jgi:hypothetical protein